MERRAWKQDLIARVEARVHRPAQALPPSTVWPRLTERTAEYHRVRVTGVFLHDRETLVQAVTDRGAGYWVMTPLRFRDGVVLVNRGFVAATKAHPATRQPGQIAGEVKVTGLLRMSEPAGGFLRSNDPAAERWYSRDVAAISRARHLAGTAPFFIDADPTPNPGGYPVGGLTVIRFSDNHLVYALTWFALASLAAGALWRLLRAPEGAKD